MADANAVAQAKTAFTALCKMLDEHDWKYKTNELTVTCSARGDDLPIPLNIEVDADRKLIILMSELPFEVPADRRMELALAVSVVNYVLVDGSFDYNYQTGHLLFRMTSSFRESLIGKDLFEYMVYVSCRTIDDYNDKFLMVAKNMYSADDLDKLIKSKA